MRNIIVILLFLLISSCSLLKRKGTCSDSNEYPSKIVNKIKIKPYIGTPSFYYAAKSYVVFISPEDMSKYLGQFKIENKELPSYKLIERIKSEINLKSNKNLLEYDFETWSYGNLIESLVVGLAKKGYVSVVSPGGTQLEFITSAEHNEIFANYTVVYASDEEGFNSMLFERYCIAD